MTIKNWQARCARARARARVCVCVCVCVLLSTDLAEMGRPCARVQLNTLHKPFYTFPDTAPAHQGRRGKKKEKTVRTALANFRTPEKNYTVYTCFTSIHLYKCVLPDATKLRTLSLQTDTGILSQL